VYHHPFVPDHVLSAHFGDHTIHVIVVAAPRQVPVVHHVTGGVVRGRNNNHHQYTLQVNIREVQTHPWTQCIQLRMYVGHKSAAPRILYSIFESSWRFYLLSAIFRSNIKYYIHKRGNSYFYKRSEHVPNNVLKHYKTFRF